MADVTLDLAAIEVPEVCGCCLGADPARRLYAPASSVKVRLASIPICSECAATHGRFLRAMNIVTLVALAAALGVVLAVYPAARHPSPLTPPVTFAYCGAMMAALVVGAVAFIVMRGRAPYRRAGHVLGCRPVRFTQGTTAIVRNAEFAARCNPRQP